MNDYTDAVIRAIKERGEKGIIDPVALVAMNRETLIRSITLEIVEPAGIIDKSNFTSARRSPIPCAVSR